MYYGLYIKKLFAIICILGIFLCAPFSTISAQELPIEPACNNAIPEYSPDLYRVDVTPTSATLFFTVQNETRTGYTVSYGLMSDATGYTEHFIEEPHNGVIMFTLDNLAQDATFYFKVRSENGCAHGPWSAIRQSGYPSSGQPQLPTTGGTNYLFWIGFGGLAMSFTGIALIVF